MSVESATKIQELNPVNPLDADPIYQGAAHIRMLKECLQNPASAFTPTGVVVAFASADAPDGWLLCDGAAVSRTTYAALFVAIGSGSIWGSGDGSTTFNLPDLRGVFIRGLNTSGSGYDPSRSLSAVPQADALKDHTHTANHAHTASIADHSHTASVPDYLQGGVSPNFSGGAAYEQPAVTVTTSGATYSSSPAVTVASATVTTSSPSTGAATESRPVNIAMNYIIKY